MSVVDECRSAADLARERLSWSLSRLETSQGPDALLTSLQTLSEDWSELVHACMVLLREVSVRPPEWAAGPRRPVSEWRQGHYQDHVLLVGEPSLLIHRRHGAWVVTRMQPDGDAVLYRDDSLAACRQWVDAVYLARHEDELPD